MSEVKGALFPALVDSSMSSTQPRQDALFAQIQVNREQSEDLERLRAQVTELQESNTAEVERRRAAEKVVNEIGELIPDSTMYAMRLILDGCLAATIKHPNPYASPHEAWAIMLEELEEVWDEIKAKDFNQAAYLAEVVDVAAVCMRILAQS